MPAQLELELLDSLRTEQQVVTTAVLPTKDYRNTDFAGGAQAEQIIPGIVHLDSIYVVPERLGEGIRRKIIENIEEWDKVNGAAAILCLTKSEAIDAEFLSANGYHSLFGVAVKILSSTS